MSFGVVLEGMTIAAFLILLAGGKQKREQGWRVMASLVAVAAVVQAIGISLIVSKKAYLYIYQLIRERHIFSKMTSAFLTAGSWIRAG